MSRSICAKSPNPSATLQRSSQVRQRTRRATTMSAHGREPPAHPPPRANPCGRGPCPSVSPRGRPTPGGCRAAARGHTGLTYNACRRATPTHVGAWPGPSNRNWGNAYSASRFLMRECCGQQGAHRRCEARKGCSPPPREGRTLTYDLVRMLLPWKTVRAFPFLELRPLRVTLRIAKLLPKSAFLTSWSLWMSRNAPSKPCPLPAKSGRRAGRRAG